MPDGYSAGKRPLPGMEYPPPAFRSMTKREAAAHAPRMPSPTAHDAQLMRQSGAGRFARHLQGFRDRSADHAVAQRCQHEQLGDLPQRGAAIFAELLDQIVNGIQDRCQAFMFSRQDHPRYQRGDALLFESVEGYVDDPANPQGIVVSVDVLQQGLLVRLPFESLQLLP